MPATQWFGVMPTFKSGLGSAIKQGVDIYSQLRQQKLAEALAQQELALRKAAEERAAQQLAFRQGLASKQEERKAKESESLINLRDVQGRGAALEQEVMIAKLNAAMDELEAKRQNAELEQADAVRAEQFDRLKQVVGLTASLVKAGQIAAANEVLNFLRRNPDFGALLPNGLSYSESPKQVFEKRKYGLASALQYSPEEVKTMVGAVRQPAVSVNVAGRAEALHARTKKTKLDTLLAARKALLDKYSRLSSIDKLLGKGKPIKEKINEIDKKIAEEAGIPSRERGKVWKRYDKGGK